MGKQQDKTSKPIKRNNPPKTGMDIYFSLPLEVQRKLGPVSKLPSNWWKDFSKSPAVIKQDALRTPPVVDKLAIEKAAKEKRIQEAKARQPQIGPAQKTSISPALKQVYEDEYAKEQRMKMYDKAANAAQYIGGGLELIAPITGPAAPYLEGAGTLLSTGSSAYLSGRAADQNDYESALLNAGFGTLGLLGYTPFARMANIPANTAKVAGVTDYIADAGQVANTTNDVLMEAADKAREVHQRYGRPLSDTPVRNIPSARSMDEAFVNSDNMTFDDWLNSDPMNRQVVDEVEEQISRREMDEFGESPDFYNRPNPDIDNSWNLDNIINRDIAIQSGELDPWSAAVWESYQPYDWSGATPSWVQKKSLLARLKDKAVGALGVADEKLGQLISPPAKLPADITLGKLSDEINQELVKGVGVKKNPLDLRIALQGNDDLTHLTANTQYIDPATNQIVDLGRIHLARQMKPYGSKKFSEILFPQRKPALTEYEKFRGPGLEEWANTLGFRKTGDYPYMNSYMTSIPHSDFVQSGISGEYNKAINEVLKRNNLGNILSGGNSHSDDGLLRWRNLVNKGFAEDFGGELFKLKRNGGWLDKYEDGGQVDQFQPGGKVQMADTSTAPKETNKSKKQTSQLQTYYGPLQFENCQGAGCSKIATTEIANTFGLNYGDLHPQDAWYRRASVLKNKGKEVWNPSMGNDYSGFRVGDLVSLNRAGNDYEKTPSVTPGYTLADNEGNEHVGEIVGSTKEGIPLIKHGSEHGKIYVQPITNLVLPDANPANIPLYYKPQSVYRLAELENAKIKDNKFYTPPKPSIPLVWKNPNRKPTANEKKYIAAINANAGKQQQLFGLSPEEATMINNLGFGIFHNESNAGNTSWKRPVAGKMLGAELFHAFGRDASASLSDVQFKYDDSMYNADKSLTGVGRRMQDIGVKREGLSDWTHHRDDYNDEVNSISALMSEYLNKFKNNPKYKYNEKSKTIYGDIPIDKALINIYHFGPAATKEKFLRNAKSYANKALKNVRELTYTGEAPKNIAIHKNSEWFSKLAGTPIKEDGGTINYNDYSVSAPEGYVGSGYFNEGRNYSPAWGGQFQMGGSLPGAVGFMYARTNDPAPSNGPYAKKTKASAQNGTQIKTNIPVPIDEIKKANASAEAFNKQYVQSPNFISLLQKQGYSPDEIKRRQDIVLGMNNDDYTYTNFGPNYVYGDESGKTKINYNQGGLGDWSNFGDIAAHEWGHVGVTRFGEDALKPAEQYMLISRLNMENVSGDEEAAEHDMAPQENRADLVELRKALQDRGIYDSFKGGEFKQEHLDQLRNYKGDKDEYWNRSMRLYKDKDIIDLMNTIAANNPQQGIPVAQKGKKIKLTNAPGRKKDITLEKFYEDPKETTYQANHELEDSLKDIINPENAVDNATSYVSKYDPVNNWGVHNGPLDAVRHAAAAAETSSQLANLFPALKYTPAGMMGSILATNAMGLGHELSSPNPWEERSSDLYNNFIGSVLGVLPGDGTKRNKRITQALNNKILSNLKGKNSGIKPFDPTIIKSLGKKDKKSKPSTFLFGHGPLNANVLDLVNTMMDNNVPIPIKENGGNMSYYQNGLDFKPKIISKNGKKIIKDDMGQWAHPGEITEIGSNQITMQGVPYPVLGISNTGDTQMMYPDQEYQFIGDSVTEYPMMKQGGQLTKLNQLTNFTNYNTKQPGGWLDKYQD